MMGRARKSDSAAVRASESRKIKEGGRRMPGTVMPPEVVEAMDRLRAGEYGKSASACIYRALLEADIRMRRR